MFIQQLYTGCLSEAAYYIESNGEAAVIDPLRDIDGYLQLANERKARIKYIFETHFHADFVSRSPRSCCRYRRADRIWSRHANEI